MNEPTSNAIAPKLFFGLGSFLMILTVLYFGKPVLLPLALSVLLAFILNPLVKSLEKCRLGRTLSVLIASGLAFALIGAAGWALASQVQRLAADLPNHQQEIKKKIDGFKATEGSTYRRLTVMFEELFPSRTSNRRNKSPSIDKEERETEATNELSASDDPSDEKSTDALADSPTAKPPKLDPTQAAPAPVFVVSQPFVPNSSLNTAMSILLPVIEPLGVAALVVVLVIFLLLRREDVRYRAIALMGDSALTGTTRLLRDAAGRVSSYLLSLLGVNAAFGVWFAVGLYLLGVPYAPLWGFLTLCFRFIPFVGSPASVLFPLLISIATSTGWSQPMWVLIFFSASELITANVIEPILFGKTTGLTPIALLVAVLFWTWVWGPVGLLLSTPLTVCLVVLGQHVPHLRSLKVLLAEQPTLDAKLQYFQPLLAGDATEGRRVFTAFAKEKGLEEAFEEVILPAVRLTRRERARGNISPEEESFVLTATLEMIAPELLETIEPSPRPIKSKNSISGETNSDRLNIYAHPVHHESEQIALKMLQNLIKADCDVYLSNTKKLPSKVVDQIESSQPDVVVLTIVPPGGIPQVKFMCNEIRARCPDLCIIVANLKTVTNYDDLLVELRKEGATYMTTSLGQTTNQIKMLIESDIESPSILDTEGPDANTEGKFDHAK